MIVRQKLDLIAVGSQPGVTVTPGLTLFKEWGNLCVKYRLYTLTNTLVCNLTLGSRDGGRRQWKPFNSDELKAVGFWWLGSIPIQATSLRVKEHIYQRGCLCVCWSGCQWCTGSL